LDSSFSVSQRRETEVEVPALEVTASLSIDVYPDETAARGAAEKRGGIVFEVDAASLRECNEFDSTFV